ncbi:electron transfer flavoprotein subunit beta/FixA family protein [Shuttleworthella satelles]|uniref:Electron transfer flavoprotein small subunit n=1 Tax=Shuttleworthella satelles DSM 14600 TaxID=626523 RepID=C4GBX3_9FIRM|nr:electron transfer flavoprotein subunit beta/FixA family protein [Shuttleworthia satelles]EEP28616.1 electron transfer flavoprotein domain protein [Shuttleworthia satelles DSM 14600]
MKIVVCIKQVPDTKGGVVFNPDGTLNRAAMMTIMNPDDKAGLEAALRLKDQFGAEVTVLTMGLPKAADALREALAMGADKAVLVTDRCLGGADTWATSSTLAAALRNLDYDIIFAGRQAIDGDTAQVGPQIAEHLGLPVISYAEEVKVDGDAVVVKRQYEDRYHMVKAKMPVLITALSELNEPRYMTPAGIWDAVDAEITTWGRADLKDLDDSNIGLAGSPTKIARASDKVRKGAGEKVELDPSASVDYVMDKLVTKHII